MGPKTKNDCAGKGWQQFTKLKMSVKNWELTVGHQHSQLVVGCKQRKSPLLEATTKQ
jgi:hypothetical protein